MHVLEAVDTPYQAPVFTRIPRGSIELEGRCAGLHALGARVSVCRLGEVWLCPTEVIEVPH